ncbi:MAG: hypothetical protein ABWY55_11815, partial [Microbacterium sp.]
AQVLSRVGVSQVRLQTTELERLLALRGVVHGEQVQGGVQLTVADADDFVRTLVSSGVDFRDLTVRGATLEEAFLALTDPLRAGAPPLAQQPPLAPSEQLISKEMS